MKVIGKLFLVVTLSMLPLPSIEPAGLSPLLAKIAQALECSHKDSNPIWKVERSDPIRPNENVLIEVFVSSGRRVKVSILEHESEAAAIEAMKRVAAAKSPNMFPNVADAASSFRY